MAMPELRELSRADQLKKYLRRRRPPIARRENHCEFWNEIAHGYSTEDASLFAGIPSASGFRIFLHNGGMRPKKFSTEPTGRYLQPSEREEIAILREKNVGVREIARLIDRSASTVSRELRRNVAVAGGYNLYRAHIAQWRAELKAMRPKPAKLTTNARLLEYVRERLAGKIINARGKPIGPIVKFTGRQSVPRKDRRWAASWSPEQISNRLLEDFPDDKTMRISHEAIYQSLYIQGRGSLKRELVACLRTGRALRVPRERSRRKAASVRNGIMISERPAEADDRAVPGHWEGDLILGSQSSAIGTLVERTTRFTILLHLPRMKNFGAELIKNGPALTGHGAEAVRKAIAKSILRLPHHLKRSLTWDQGTEMAQHNQLRVEANLPIYFCDPQSPWQRGTNENTNGLLRQYFPKGTDLSRHSKSDLEAVAAALNGRPRKTLHWKTPSEALNDLLQSS